MWKIGIMWKNMAPGTEFPFFLCRLQLDSVLVIIFLQHFLLYVLEGRVGWRLLNITVRLAVCLYNILSLFPFAFF